jgi:heme A synthase
VRVDTDIAATSQLGSPVSSQQQKLSIELSSAEDDTERTQKLKIHHIFFAFTLSVALFALAFKWRLRPAETEMSERSPLVTTTSREVDGYSSVI